jgi:enoyl-CoA hydratase
VNGHGDDREEEDMAYENLVYEIADRIATVTINRPKVLNALNLTTIAELEAAFRVARDDAAVRVVILTGAGEKAFIGGADVKELHEILKGSAAAGREALSLRGRPLIKLMQGLGKPVIAAVNGYCLGGGMELLYASTLAYAADGARFGHPEINLGIYPLLGGTQQLPRLVGAKKAMELLLLGDMIDAGEAARLGVVNGVVPKAELMPTVHRVAAALAVKPPLAARLITDLVWRAGDVALERGMDLEANGFGLVCGTEDAIEGTRAFIEKRQPAFRGG